MGMMKEENCSRTEAKARMLESKNWMMEMKMQRMEEQMKKMMEAQNEMKEERNKMRREQMKEIEEMRASHSAEMDRKVKEIQRVSIIPINFISPIILLWFLLLFFGHGHNIKHISNLKRSYPKPTQHSNKQIPHTSSTS